MVDWAWSLGARQHHFVFPNEWRSKSGAQWLSRFTHRGGFAMPPPDKFDWYVIGAALLAVLVVVALVALFQ